MISNVQQKSFNYLCFTLNKILTVINKQLIHFTNTVYFICSITTRKKCRKFNNIRDEDFFCHHQVQSKISKQSINEFCDTFFTFDLFLLWCSQNFDTAVSYKHDRYSRVLKTITVLLLYIYYCSFFLFFISKNKVAKFCLKSWNKIGVLQLQ